MISLVLIGCNNEQSSIAEGELPTEINIGYLRVPNDEMVAMTEGLFKEYFDDKGIKTNFVIFDSGVDANKALSSGSIDFASMGHTNGVIALATGLDVELIWLHEILGEIEGLAVQKDSGINQIEDLAGKTVATTFASTSHYSLLQILNEMGITEDVELLDMQTMDIVAAWERDDIDAAYTWQPSLGRILETGNLLISSEQVADMGHKTANITLARKAFSENYPELVADVIAAMAEGGNLYRENKENAAEIVAEPLEISVEEALNQMQGSIWLTPEEEITQEYLGTSEQLGDFANVMKETADFLEDQGSISNSPDQKMLDAFIEPKYIEIFLAREE
ncbi:taurine ABC transporter substrate-binding protein [Amphibacillus sp. Q70]|uniref:taurine ABC transporter substrate-binding protein n=1 Tax=Amphibacillus sp. Q70 TaxID=3453416 RepID=UPI003F840DF6